MGKLFRHSKLKVSWEFQVDTSSHCVELVYSRYSSKLRLFVDGNSNFDGLYYGKYQTPLKFELNGRPTVIEPTGSGSFSLVIHGVGTLPMPVQHSKRTSERVCPTQET